MTLRIIVLAAMLALASSQQACTAYCVKGTEPTTRTVAAGAAAARSRARAA